MSAIIFASESALPASSASGGFQKVQNLDKKASPSTVSVGRQRAGLVVMLHGPSRHRRMWAHSPGALQKPDRYRQRMRVWASRPQPDGGYDTRTLPRTSQW